MLERVGGSVLFTWHYFSVPFFFLFGQGLFHLILYALLFVLCVIIKDEEDGQLMFTFDLHPRVETRSTQKALLPDV